VAAVGGALVPVDVLPKRVIKSARLKLITPEPPFGTVFPDASTEFPEASRVVVVVVVGGRTVVVPGVVVVVPDFSKIGMVPEYPPHILPNCELILSVLRR
jgi:hypothetical protein